MSFEGLPCILVRIISFDPTRRIFRGWHEKYLQLREMEDCILFRISFASFDHQDLPRPPRGLFFLTNYSCRGGYTIRWCKWVYRLPGRNTKPAFCPGNRTRKFSCRPGL